MVHESSILCNVPFYLWCIVVLIHLLFPDKHRRSNPGGQGGLHFVLSKMQKDRNTLIEQSVTLIRQSVCKIVLKIELRRLNPQNFPVEAQTLERSHRAY